MPGRILGMGLMKEKEELPFNGQRLKLSKHTQNDEWSVTPLLWQAWLQPCQMSGKDKLIIWRAGGGGEGEEKTILLWKCIFGMSLLTLDGLGIKTVVLRKSL